MVTVGKFIAEGVTVVVAGTVPVGDPPQPPAAMINEALMITIPNEFLGFMRFFSDLIEVYGAMRFLVIPPSSGARPAPNGLSLCLDYI